MQVDAVEQRSGNALAVVFDLPWIAAALAFTITVVATRTGISFQEITKRNQTLIAGFQRIRSLCRNLRFEWRWPWAACAPRSRTGAGCLCRGLCSRTLLAQRLAEMAGYFNRLLRRHFGSSWSLTRSLLQPLIYRQPCRLRSSLSPPLQIQKKHHQLLDSYPRN